VIGVKFFAQKNITAVIAKEIGFDISAGDLSEQLQVNRFARFGLVSAQRIKLLAEQFGAFASGS
jgi:hypothetical protein